MIRHTLAIARTELQLGIRNRWVLLASGMLLLFALVLGFLGSAPAGEFKIDRLTITVASLATLSVYLVPLLALLVSYDGIAGEIERGTLPLMLASPVWRGSIILGKFLGQSVVVAMAILFGYGIAAIVVSVSAGTDTAGLGSMTRLILTSQALGCAFIAISLIASTLVKQASTAAALAVGIWLFAVVLYDLGLLGLLVSQPDGPFAGQVFPWLLLVNPADAFRVYNLTGLAPMQLSSGVASTTQALPYSAWAALVSLGGWIVGALGLAIVGLKRVEP